VTGKLEAFATHARIVHIDVAPAEIHKNKHAHVPLCSDVKPALKLLNKLLEAEPVSPELCVAAACTCLHLPAPACTCLPAWRGVPRWRGCTRTCGHLRLTAATDPPAPRRHEPWRQELAAKKAEFPMRYPHREDVIIPQHAVEVGRCLGRVGLCVTGWLAGWPAGWPAASPELPPVLHHSAVGCTAGSPSLRP
jgi:acetolactate synthase-1/2/3 large subunit